MSVDMQFMQDLRDGKHLEGLSPDAKRKADELRERFPIIPQHTNGCMIHACLDWDDSELRHTFIDHHPSKEDIDNFISGEIGMELTEKQYIDVLRYKSVVVPDQQYKNCSIRVWLTDN